MDHQSQRAGPFTRRRTFTLGPTLPHPAPSSVSHQIPAPKKLEKLGQSPPPHRFQRTVSAPTFTRRAVDPVVFFPATGLTTTTTTTTTQRRRPLPPRSYSQETRSSLAESVVHRPVSPVASLRGELLHYVNGSHSISPDPRKPYDALLSDGSMPNVSPIRSLFGSAVVSVGAAVEDDDASLSWRPPQPQSDEVVLPSIVSSVHSGSVGPVTAASPHPKWWYAALASTRHRSPSDTPVTEPAVPAAAVTDASSFQPSAVAEHSILTPFRTPVGKGRRTAGENLVTFTHTFALDHTPARRASVDDVSSFFPDTPGQTMPPHKRKEPGHHLPRSVPQVRIHVEGCTGLPRAPFCAPLRASPSEANPNVTASAAPTNGNEVYVYMRPSHGGRRYKSSSVPYAAAVRFPENSHDFLVPFAAAQANKAGGGDNEILTFTVAVKLTSGKQVKLGIGQLALCNLREGYAVRVPMPIVAKPATSRARERGVLMLLVEAEGCGVSRERTPPLEESVVRQQILSVARRVCRERLHQLEVDVRRCCFDSAAELRRFLTRLEADHLLAHASTNLTGQLQNPVVISEGAPQRNDRTGRSAVSSSSSSPSSPEASQVSGKASSSFSPFTSCVLEERPVLHRSFSCDAAFGEEKRGRPRRTNTAGAGSAVVRNVSVKADVQRRTRTSHAGKPKRNVPVLRGLSPQQLCDSDVRLQRSYSAPLSPKHLRRQRSQAAATPHDTCASPAVTLHRGQLRVAVQSVWDLRDEDGLPLFECANCFVRVEVLGSAVPDQPVAATEPELVKAFTTDSTTYTNFCGVFGDSCSSAATLSVACTAMHHAVLRCWVCHGAKGGLHEIIGSCEASVSPLSAYPTEEWEREYLLVRHAGSPQAHPCGHLRLSITVPHQDDIKSSTGKEAYSFTPCAKDWCPNRDVLHQRVLSYLWHNCRAELHRLDSVVKDAAASGVDSALAKYSTPAHGDRSSSTPAVYLTSRNIVRIFLRTVLLRQCATAKGSKHHVMNGETAAAAAMVAQGISSVFVGWCCGCYGGRSNLQCVGASDAYVCFNEELSIMTDVDPWRDELCLVLYGLSKGDLTGNSSHATARELCRVHVSLRSFRASQKARAVEAVQLPLVWHAGERGAYEQGQLLLDVEATAPPSSLDHPSKDGTACSFRQRKWDGFDADWAPRRAVVQVLRCYATDQLHRLLPLLSDAEGKEEVLLKRLKATYGTTKEPVQLRVCLVGFRCFCAEYRKCYLKVYHKDEAVLRTPTITCNAAAAAAGFVAHNSKRIAPCFTPEQCEVNKGGCCTVPLLDEDKYLFYLTTATPHHDTVLLKMGVEHFIRKNDVVAFAEVNFGAFVSLESRLEESMQKPPSQSRSPSLGNTSTSNPSPRPPLWVPLCSSEDGTVAEVAVRVEWVHTAPLAPVRRVTTQKKSTVTAVLRAGNNCVSSVCGEAIPLFDRPAARDLFSLLTVYRPWELYRWSWYLARWGDATKAHQRLRRELLPPPVSATVYIDLAGVSPRSPASLARRTTTTRTLFTQKGLAVVAACLGSASSSCPVRCGVLPAEAARATVQAAAVLASLDAADTCDVAAPTVRLDLQIPSSNETQADLCLVFFPQARFSASLPVGHTRAASVPRRGRRSHSAEHFRQLRSRSAAAPGHALHDGTTISPQRGACGFPARRSSIPIDKDEVGRVYLSLRALTTTPQLYREGEMVVVPLVSLIGGDADGGGGQRGSAAVVGDVYLRVRPPSHESVPKWLRYSENETRRICGNGRCTRKDVRACLQQHQLRLEFAANTPATALAEVHASFFRQRAADAAAPSAAGSSGKCDGNPGVVATSAMQPPPPASQKSARPPLVPRRVQAGKQTTDLPGAKAEDGVFTVHDVFPRGGSNGGSVSTLDDFATPQACKADRSVQEWSSERGGVTVDRSSGTRLSTSSLRTVSSHESRLTTKRALIF